MCKIDKIAIFDCHEHGIHCARCDQDCESRSRVRALDIDDYLGRRVRFIIQSTMRRIIITAKSILPGID